MFDFDKKLQETEEEYIWRLGLAKDTGVIELSWDDIAELVNKNFAADEKSYKSSSTYRTIYCYVKKFYDAGIFNDSKQEAYIKIIKEEKKQLELEKQKWRDEKKDYNRMLREESRDGLIYEHICEAVRELEPLPIPEPIPKTYHETTGILCFGDTHYGTEFTIKGLNGDTINEYSPEIFMQRMGELLQMAIDKVKREGLTTIKVYSLGDEIDGILRASQLMKLRYGVVESTIKYADYICRWLTRLSEEVVVEFQMTRGNHSELRMLSQPKGTFVDDNMSEVIRQFIKTRMEGNPNFIMYENESGLIFDTIYGYNILGIHGEVKNLRSAIDNFTNIYKTDIDVLIGGHTHHFSSETIGSNRDVISVPSIIGIDSYAMQIGKASNPGATFLIIEDGKGLVEQTVFKFNV